MKPKHKQRKALSIISSILLFIAAVSVILLLIARKNPIFAERLNRFPGGAIRAALAFLTNAIPFSLAEFFIILLPIAVTILIVYAIKQKSSHWRDVLNYFVSLLTIVSVIFSLFIFSFGIGYHVPTLYERFDIPNDGSDTDSLRITATKLAAEVNRRAGFIEYSDNGSSVMPYTLSGMNDKLMAAYKKTSGELGFLQNFKSKIKPVLLSVPMSYTHTTGIYTFFTGEANINVDFPDYTIPYTAAHELAHQRGISRENEANFIAFLVGVNSEDLYIEYSTYLNMLEYVASALYAEDAEAYRQVYDMLCDDVKGELAAYSEFFSKYRNSTASEVSSAINNAYLIANGTKEGTKSYGLVVDLAIAYFDGYFD